MSEPSKELVRYGLVPCQGGWSENIEKDPSGEYIMYDDALAALAARDAELAALRRQVEVLKELARCKDALLVCYRVGRRPSEALFTRIGNADAACRAAGVEVER